MLVSEMAKCIQINALDSFKHINLPAKWLDSYFPICEIVQRP